MNPKRLLRELPPLVMIGAMFALSAGVYPLLPGQVPMHWDIHGEIDGYWTKGPAAVLFIPLLAIGIWLLMLLLPKFDRRGDKYKEFTKEFDIIRSVIIGFFLFLHIIILAAALGRVSVGRMIPAGVSVLFMLLGAFMGKIRQNSFVGFRLPWTLADETNWNKTHRVGGRVLVIAGMLSLTGLFFSTMVQYIVLMGAIWSAVGFTSWYSWRLHQQQKKNIGA
jgi:uncharacterized membrane protein